jgi:hypothetical protein
MKNTREKPITVVLARKSKTGTKPGGIVFSLLSLLRLSTVFCTTNSCAKAHNFHSLQVRKAPSNNMLFHFFRRRKTPLPPSIASSQSDDDNVLAAAPTSVATRCRKEKRGKRKQTRTESARAAARPGPPQRTGIITGPTLDDIISPNDKLKCFLLGRDNLGPNKTALELKRLSREMQDIEKRTIITGSNLNDDIISPNDKLKCFLLGRDNLGPNKTALKLERLSREMLDIEERMIAHRQETVLDPDCVRPCPTYNFEQKNKRMIDILVKSY